MSNEAGKSFAPILWALLMFTSGGTAIFFIDQYLFVGGEVSYLTIDRIDFSISASAMFFILGLTIVLALSLFVYILAKHKYYTGTYFDTSTQELLKSRDFFLRLFDDSPVPYMMVDTEGTITLPNKAAQRLFGRSAEELFTYKFFQLHDEAYYVQSRQLYERFSRGVATSDVELEIVQKSGRKRWVKVSALPYRVLGSSGDGGVVTFIDITEEKAIDRVKTEFVSLASHQLRTPLTAMKWYGEMVLAAKEELSEKQRKYIQKIYNGNERMIELVNLLLSASRLELGNLTIDIQNIDPIPIIKTLLEELQPKIRERNVQIVEKYTGDNTNFYTDKKLITMILQNLVSNAIKYTKTDGYVKISLEFTNEHLNITVEDNGLGIPSDQQEKIFSKMFRADNARLSDTEGTGLGLYIVKEAVEALSGEISFTSKENEGTMFMVVLPNGTHGNTNA